MIGPDKGASDRFLYSVLGLFVALPLHSGLGHRRAMSRCHDLANFDVYTDIEVGSGKSALQKPLWPHANHPFRPVDTTQLLLQYIN